MRGKKRYKKLLAWLLCICLMLGVIPNSAFAVNAEQQDQTASVTQESKDNQKKEEKTEKSEQAEESSKSDDTTQQTKTEEKSTTEETAKETTTTEQKSTTEEKKDEKNQVATQSSKDKKIATYAAATFNTVELKHDDAGNVFGKGILTGSDLDDKCWVKGTETNKGYDDSELNDIIRSFDTIKYAVVSTFNDLGGTAHTLVYKITVPNDDELTLDTTSMTQPVSTETVTSADGKSKTFICKYNLKENFSSGEETVQFGIKVGNKHQGDVIEPTIEAYLDDNETSATKIKNVEPVTVTTAPMYNIVLEKNAKASVTRDTYDFSKTDYKSNAEGYDNYKVDGYKCTYGVALELRKPGEGIKGVELPDPDKDFTFDIDLSDAKLGDKDLIANNFGPLLYYVGANKPGSDAVTSIPFTNRDEVGSDYKDQSCYNSGDFTVTQEGTTLHVTVKNFAIDKTKFPKENYNKKTYWTDLNEITEGIFSSFQFQVVYPFINKDKENLQTKLGDGNVNVSAVVKDMVATSEQNHTTKDETSLDDNKQTNFWYLTSGDTRSQTVYYAQRNSNDGYVPSETRKDGDIAAVGAQDLAFSIQYSQKNVGESSANKDMPVAVDQFVLFDRSAIQDVELSKTWTKDNQYDYTRTVLYAVRKDGRMDNDTMRTAKLEDFTFSTEKPEGGCDGVLVQYRGAMAYKSELTFNTQFNATVSKDPAVAKKVYMITAFTKTWTASDLQDKLGMNDAELSALTKTELNNKVQEKVAAQTASTDAEKASAFVNDVTPSLPTLDNRTENDYTVPYYTDKGVKDDTVGPNGTTETTHKFNPSFADALYIVPYKVTVTKNVAQLDEKNDPMRTYNLAENQKYVDYRITSSMNYGSEDITIPEGSKTTVYLEDTLPKGLTYVEGSANWGGTYTSKFPAAGKTEGGKQIEPTVTKNNDGTTVLKWTIPDVELIKGELPNLYYTCKISNSVETGATLKNVVKIQTDEDKRPVYDDKGVKNDNSSDASISITRNSGFYMTKRGGDSLELEDNSYYEMVAANTSGEDKKNVLMIDTLPYDKNEDANQSKQFKGKYQITKLTMDADDVNHADDMELWYTNDEKYKGKTAKDIKAADITSENGWHKATGSGYTGDTITFEGEGLIGGWPTAIAYKDPNLNNNTTATLRLEYKAVAGAEKDDFTNVWSTILSDGKETQAKAHTDVYNRTIEGTVWYDKDQDGKIGTDETKLKDVKVTLLVKDENGKYVPYTGYHETVDGKTVQSEAVTYTDENGHYKFSGLPSGDYRVKFESSENTDLGYYDVTKPNEGTDKTVTSKVEKENAEKDKDGKLTSGTIEDIKMPTLEQMVSEKDEKGTTYELKHQNLGLIAPTTNISVTKTWNDNNNQDGKRPSSIEVTLYKNGEATDKKLTITPSADGTWTGEFTNLPKYDDTNPQKLTPNTYTVKETSKVTGYTTGNPIGDATNGFVITNTHTPSTINIPVQKVWNDNKNQDGKRTPSVTVRLFANGTAVTDKVLTLTEAGDWKGTFENLPEYSGGQKINYTVVEDTVNGYRKDVTGDITSGYTVTNTNTPETVDISGSKTWDDSNNQDGERPATITVNLLANGTKVDSQTVSQATGWKYSFTGKPKYDNGTEITYTVTEDAVPKYTTTYDGNNIKNSYTPGKTSVTVTKAWDDGDNQDNIRPAEVTVRLYANGDKTDKTITLKASENWSGSFKDLDLKKDGQTIKYTVKEDTEVNGYTSEVTGNATEGYTVTNKHTPAVTEVSGSKTWDDKDNQDGVRPGEIVINLYKGLEKIASQKVTADKDGNWNYKFENLPKYEKGNEIQYTVTEEAVEGYTSKVEGTNVINTHSPAKTSVKVTKEWVDGNNQDKIRPDEVTVRLYANGDKTDKTITLKASENWSGSFTDLDLKKDGEIIKYTVKEDTKVDGYTSEVTGDAIEGYTVTNTHTPYVVKVSGSKTWDDKDNQDGIRPDSITIHLLANGTEVDSKEVTAADNWSYEFANLPKNKEGNAINYTIKEEAVKGYETTIDGYNVTNKHTPETTEVSGSKTWKDNDDQDGARPDTITIRLLANGEEVDSKEVTADKDGNWEYDFTGLDKYKKGEQIVYTVTEDVVKDYTTKVEGYDVINTHNPEKTSVTVTKAWRDENNQDGIRPDSVTVHLYADGVDTGKTITLKKSDNWVGSFTDLDAKSKGQTIKYTVKEDKVTGYETDITGDATKGYVVTNKHTPEVTEVSGSKTWDDKDNQDGKRPDKITIRVLANGVEVANKEVTAADNWSYNFTNLPKNADGKAIVYTVTEDAVNDYVTTVNGYNVTNSYTPGKTSVTVTKSWSDKNNKYKKRPSKVTVHLYADGVDTGKKLTLTKATNWSGSFTDLDQYKAGNKINYTIKEDKVTNYTGKVTGDSDKGYVVTNTYNKKPGVPDDENLKDKKPNNSSSSSNSSSSTSTSNNPTGTGRSAKTGDTNAVLPWMLVCAASLGAIFIATRRKRK